jgi:hypothetical protein
MKIGREREKPRERGREGESESESTRDEVTVQMGTLQYNRHMRAYL